MDMKAVLAGLGLKGQVLGPGLGREGPGLGRGLGLEPPGLGPGLGLEARVLVNIPGRRSASYGVGLWRVARVQCLVGKCDEFEYALL